jgi:hypothetical protein
MAVRLVPGKGQWLLAPRAPRPLAWELMPEECRSQLVALGLALGDVLVVQALGQLDDAGGRGDGRSNRGKAAAADAALRPGCRQGAGGACGADERQRRAAERLRRWRGGRAAQRTQHCS